MINEYLKLFNIDSDATIDDVKKAYRTLAMKNHPDRFTGEAEKREQGAKMMKINEAYRGLLSFLEHVALKAELSEAMKENSPCMDYTLYKKGLEYFNIYIGSYKKNRVIEFDIDILLENKNILERALFYFKKLVHDYPDSDWTYDSESKIKTIGKIISDLDSRINDINLYSPYWTNDGGSPYNRKRKKD
jgi:curved DNA-binding protein CbpA